MITDDITIFSSVPLKESDYEKLENLTGSKKPQMLWVDNSNNSYRYWNLFMLFSINSKTFNYTYFAIGSYKLILHPHTVINKTENGYIFFGEYTFKKGNFVIKGENITLSEDGIFSFPVTLTSPDELDIGICYFTTMYDDFLERKFPLEIKSPFIILEKSETFTIDFSPASYKKNRAYLTEKRNFETLFTTIYGKQICLTFDKDFSFVLQKKFSIDNGYDYYFAPNGTAKGIGNHKFMLGLSGSEYIGLNNEYSINFYPDNNAYFDDFKLSFMPTTSYLSFKNGGYYSQPENSKFYEAAVKICYHTQLPAIPVDNIIIPSIPCLQIETLPKSALELEMNFLVPLRSKLIKKEFEACEIKAFTPAEAITRNGMRVCIGTDKITWLRIALTNETKPQMAFTNLTNEFQASFQVNNLFMVLCDKKQLHNIGTPYSVTKQHLEIAKNNGYTDLNKLNSLLNKVYLDFNEFKNAITNVGGKMDDALKNACDHFAISLESWRFLLNPDDWDNTLIIIKYSTENNILSLIENPNMWSLTPEEEKIFTVQNVIKKTEDKLKKNQNPQLEEILNNKNWCGVVAFNCKVDIKNLPSELMFLKNGIDIENFRAEFLAFPANASLEDNLAKSNISGFIDYNDYNQLAKEDYADYEFKVLELKVCFINGKIYDFGAKIELLINKLFGSPIKLTTDNYSNNLLFVGKYQQGINGNGYYVFTLESDGLFTFNDSLIDYLNIKTAQLYTDINGCTFSFQGFIKLMNVIEFDFLSFDNLSYSGMEIRMDLTDSSYDFNFSCKQLDFITENSICRENSLYKLFPITPVKMINSETQTPTEKGYSNLWVENLDTNKIDKNWWGIVWEITSGNMGDLSADLSAKIEILTAWQISDETNKDLNFFGVKIGTLGNQNDFSLPLQGVMNLGFDSIEFHKKISKIDEKEKTSYYLQFRNFSLKIIGIRFPDSNNDLYLIADENKNLGWYGASGG